MEEKGAFFADNESVKGRNVLSIETHLCFLSSIVAIFATGAKISSSFPMAKFATPREPEIGSIEHEEKNDVKRSLLAP